MESPFYDMLHTNAIPADEDCRRIQDIVGEKRQQADGLAKEITRIRALLQGLVTRHGQFISSIDAHLVLLSPARRLPDDVLGGIFTACVPCDRAASLNGADAPLLLCHISQRWRSIALSTPLLWSSLHIVAPVTTLTAENDRLLQINAVAKTWLSRSGCLPLTISFVGPGTVARSNTHLFQGTLDACKILLETLIEFSPRWRSVRLVLPHHLSDFGPLADLTPDQVPMLRSATIDGEPFQSNLSFLTAPSLNSLSFRPPTYVFQTAIRTPLIQHLCIYQAHRLGDISGTKLLQFLRECVNLETCTLELGMMEADFDSQDSVQWDHLRELCVSNTDDAGVLQLFLGKFIIPNLSRLHYYDEDAYKRLRRLPIQSLCQSLTSLVLSVKTVLTSAVIDVLRAASSLEHLTMGWEPLASSQTDVKFLTFLTPPTPRGEPIVCPRLLTLRLLRFSALSDNTLHRFILYRSAPDAQRDSGTARLRRIEVTFNREQEMDVAAIPEIRERLAEGFEMLLKYIPPQPEGSRYLVAEGNSAYGEWDASMRDWDGIQESRRCRFGG
ncbi:hypothetical protein FB45DRAFT_1065246 [Roridomyces roridus]|uniref:F-box domain-containing protein n=1 Tax=Roridomyces roridus TaxID=1738132 RepID=A0AAD7FB08_9AGAR|nr:hypothetical protein FB45DRAFT_1065246 [Roridomyces roridus]